jgi:hypothetical protein
MTASRTLIGGIAGAVAMLGAGAPALADTTTTEYQLMLQTRTDARAPDEVFVASYASFASVVANTPSTSNYTQINIQPAYRIGGLTWDGSAYRLMLQTRVDAFAPDEVFVASYASEAALLANTPFVTGYSQIGIGAAYRVAGLTYDGAAYRLMLQTRVDAGVPDEIFIASYASFDALMANTPFVTGFTQIGINPSYAVKDFTWDGSAYRLLLQTRNDAFAPDEVFIASYSSFADLLANTPFTSSFTQIGINAAYEVVGFASVTTTIVDPPPPGVPEPESWALLLPGFGSTGFMLRRRKAVALR